MFRAAFITLFGATVATSSTVIGAFACPISPDIQDELGTLLSLTQNAQSEAEARPAINGMWLLWTRAPDEKAQALLDDGRARIRVADHEGAEKVLSELIAYCPAYAEGYNQRAFSRFLRGAYEDALVDLDKAIELSPHHVAAMSGRVLTLHALGRSEAAQDMLREALELNPWLPERHMLSKPKGTAL